MLLTSDGAAIVLARIVRIAIGSSCGGSPARNEFAEDRTAAAPASACFDHPGGAQRSPIQVQQNLSVDRVAARFPGGGRCQ